MFIAQADLFPGMNRDLVKEIMDVAVKETHSAGAVLFREGDPATYFYILLKGQIRLTVGTAGPIYTASHAGEALGWSSLLGRDVYSAAAECASETRLLKFEGKKVAELLDKDPASGQLFFKRLAATLGNRLLQAYHVMAGVTPSESSVSFGTGQTMEPAPAT